MIVHVKIQVFQTLCNVSVFIISLKNKIKVNNNGISDSEIFHMIWFKKYIFPRKCITYIDSSHYKAEKLQFDNDSETLGLSTVSLIFIYDIFRALLVFLGEMVILVFQDNQVPLVLPAPPESVNHALPLVR